MSPGCVRAPVASARSLGARVSPDAVMALGALAAFAVILYLGRHLTTFLYDEWSIFVYRREWSPDAILVPHNEHLVALPVMLFKLFFETIGAAPYWPYRVTIALLVVGLGVLVYVFAVPRIGKRAALVPGLMTVLVGAGGHDIIMPFQITLGLSVLGGIGLLLCLDHGTPKAEWWAGGSILLALASSSVGLAVLAAGIVDVLLHLNRRVRAMRILAVPAVAYALWYAHYNVTVFKPGNVLVAPQYAIDAAGGAIGALVGLAPAYYSVLVLAFLGLTAWAWLASERAPLRLLTTVTMPFAFWLLTAIGRAEEPPTSSRYLMPGAIFVALVICEALRGVRLQSRAASRAALLAALLVAFASWTHVVALRTEARAQFDLFTAPVRAELAALSLAREAGPIDPAFTLDSKRAPGVIAQPYFAAVDDLGEPTPDPVRTLATSFDGPRASADAVYFTALAAVVRPSARPTFGGPPPTVVAGVPRPGRGSCIVLPGGRPYVIVLPAGGLALRTAGPGRAEIGLRRWSGAFTKANGLDPAVWGVLRIGRDREARPVQVQIDGRGRGRACSVRS